MYAAPTAAVAVSTCAPNSSTVSITSAGSTTFAAQVAGSFTVCTTGDPTDAISESGGLPTGVTFTDNGDGTATLAGPHAAGTTGDYPIALTASYGNGADAVQDLTLTVSPQTSAVRVFAPESSPYGTAVTFHAATITAPMRHKKLWNLGAKTGGTLRIARVRITSARR
jgi:hypothetical protein